MTATITKGQIGEEDIIHFDGTGTNTFSRLTSSGGTLTLNKVGTDVDALIVYGGGVNYTNATITSALSAIGTSTKATLLIRPGTWTISTNVDWSAYTNVTFKFANGAVLSHGAYTISIPNVSAELNQQIFIGTGTVTHSGINEIYPQWYGAKGDGVAATGAGTDDRVAINKTTADANASGIKNIVFKKACYIVSTGRLNIYSNQRWLCNGSTFRLTTRDGSNNTYNIIQSVGFPSGTIENPEIYDAVLWGDGEDNGGKAANFNSTAGLSLYNVSGAILQNIESKYHGGGCITGYGLTGGKANVLRDIVAGPGWGLNAMSISPGSWVWENVSVSGDAYSRANPGMDIDIEDSVSGSATSEHWMNNVRAANLVLADRTTAAAGTFKHSVHAENLAIGPSYKALEFVSKNNLTTSNCKISNSYVSDDNTNGIGVWIDNVSGVTLNDIDIDAQYSIAVNNTVASTNLSNIRAIQQSSGDYGLFVYSATASFDNNLIIGSNLGDVYMGGLSNSGNKFYSTVIDDLTLKNSTTTNNFFDESTRINSITLSGTGHISGQHIRSRRGSIVSTYDFAIHGGTIGTIRLGETLPINATITNAHYEVITEPTSGGSATISLGVHTADQTGIQAVLAYDNAAYSAGYHDGVPDGTATNFTTKTTSARKLSITIAGANLTAGKIAIIADYVWTDN